jgi:plasmid maintenance system antidote protein VapI
VSGLRNWWRARPWQIYPLWRSGWRYHTIYRTLRRGSWNPERGAWMAGGRPRDRLQALKETVQFPHVHDDEPWEPFEPDWTVPPGETLLELMAERDMSDVDLARKMLEPVEVVHRLITGEQRITESIALDLEEVFGVKYDFWIALERRHRDWLAKNMPGCVVDLATNPAIANLAAENFIDVTRCEFCLGPLDAEHPWRRGRDGACAHEACLDAADGLGAEASG